MTKLIRVEEHCWLCYTTFKNSVTEHSSFTEVNHIHIHFAIDEMLNFYTKTWFIWRLLLIHLFWNISYLLGLPKLLHSFHHHLANFSPNEILISPSPDIQYVIPFQYRFSPAWEHIASNQYPTIHANHWLNLKKISNPILGKHLEKNF